MPASKKNSGKPPTGSPEDLGLSASEIELCEAAKKFSENAYAPYSGFHEGAAVRTSDGKIYGGANLENASYGLGICAAASALANANTSSQRQVLEIAVYGCDNSEEEVSDDPVFPCGRCRQLIHEASVRYGREIIVIACNEEMTRFAKAGISRLLPNAVGSVHFIGGIAVDEQEAEMIENIQSSLDERAEAFMKKEPLKTLKARRSGKKDDTLDGILKSISKKFGKPTL